MQLFSSNLCKAFMFQFMFNLFTANFILFDEINPPSFFTKIVYFSYLYVQSSYHLSTFTPLVIFCSYSYF